MSKMSIALDKDQWQVVVNVLTNAPWAVADPILKAIMAQANQQPDPDLFHDETDSITGSGYGVAARPGSDRMNGSGTVGG